MSLEGLNSLIQLESTRLEGARAVSQNFQSVGSTVQQQGMQTASSKNNLAMSRIDSQYTKECAEADVRKIEKRLARERASEALSKNIAGIALVANAVGNLGHMFNDIKGRQKLGDNPEYLKTPQIDPNDKANTHLNINKDPNSEANVVFASGKNNDGSYTVYSYETGKDGVSVGSLPLEANISEYDMERILGDDYTKLKSKDGKPLSFHELSTERPDLADKVFNARAHGISKDGASNLMKVLDVQLPKYTGVTSTMTNTQMTEVDAGNAEKLGKIASVTGADPHEKIKNSFDGKDAQTIAQLQNAFNNLPPQMQIDIAGDEKSLINIINDPSKSEKLRTSLTNNDDFIKKLNEQPPLSPTGNVYYSQKNEKNKDNENIQVNNNGLTFKIDDVSSEQKIKAMEKLKETSPDSYKDMDPNKYGKMSFNEIFKESPDKAAFLIANIAEEDGKIDTSKIKMPDGTAYTTQGFANLIKDNPSGASNIVEGLEKAGSKSVTPLTATQANENINAAGASKRLGESKEALKNTLVKSEKIDDRGAMGKAKDVGKAAVNFLVKTMEQSVPYFQAYLKAKERADRTYEELVAAMEKLNAANKRLKSIEMQIDVFSGRGA